jgi:hypothetical protein
LDERGLLIATKRGRREQPPRSLQDPASRAQTQNIDITRSHSLALPAAF